MRSKVHFIFSSILSFCFDAGSGAAVSHGRWKTASAAGLLLLLIASALPCGQSQPYSYQNQNQNPAAPPAALSAAMQGEQPMANESAALLKLAMELKAEVDKSNKDTLSVGVIRKAEEIERVARDMKDRYRVSVSPN
jgi:hypothetical protein